VKYKGFTPIIILLVITALGLLGYLAYTKGYVNINPSKPTPTVNPPLVSTPSPTSDLTVNWKTMVSDQFKFSLSYPPDWKYYNNANNDVIKLPYVRNFSSQNETLAKANGCAIHFGFGGAGGPSNEIQSENVVLDSMTLNRKTWLIQGNPVFMSYIYEGISPADKKFELLLAWVSKEDPGICQNEIDQILSTFKFTQ